MVCRLLEGLIGSCGERRVRRNKEPSCAVPSLKVPIKCVVFGPAVAQEAERVARWPGCFPTPSRYWCLCVLGRFQFECGMNVKWRWACLPVHMCSCCGYRCCNSVIVTLTVFWSDTCSTFIVLHCNYSTNFYFPPNLVCSIHSTSSAQMLLHFDPLNEVEPHQTNKSLSVSLVYATIMWKPIASIFWDFTYFDIEIFAPNISVGATNTPKFSTQAKPPAWMWCEWVMVTVSHENAV